MGLLIKVLTKVSKITAHLKKLKNIDSSGNKNFVTISYKIKFIGCAIFMSGSFSNLVNNLDKE